MKKYKRLFLLTFIFSSLCLASCNDGTFDHSVAPSSSKDSGDTPELKFGTTYSFYLSDKSDQLWAKISGRKGALLPSVAAPKKTGYRFKGWKTKSGAEPLPNFGSSDLSFYAPWEDSSDTKLIGSKEAPDAVGDVIFTDGSASPYPNSYDDLTDEQWKAAVAMLFTISYNPANGSNTKGGQYQYKIAAGLLAPSLMQWCTDVLYEMDDDEMRPSPSSNYYFKYKDHHFIYNFMYVGYDWDESMDDHAAEQANSLVLGPLTLSQYFGLQNYASSEQFKMLGSEDIAPAFEYAMNYGRSQKMDGALRDNWYLPSVGELKILFTDDDVFQKYNRLVIKKFIVSGSPTGYLERIVPVHSFWTSSSNGMQVPDTSIDVVTYREHNESYEPTHGRDVGPWGVANAGDGDRHNRLQVYDPCSGRIIHPMLNKTLIWKNSVIYTDVYDSSKKVDSGYAYRYVLYNKAYQIDVLGNLSFDAKTAQHSVVAMRVFD